MIKKTWRLLKPAKQQIIALAFIIGIKWILDKNMTSNMLKKSQNNNHKDLALLISLGIHLPTPVDLFTTVLWIANYQKMIALIIGIVQNLLMTWQLRIMIEIPEEDLNIQLIVTMRTLGTPRPIPVDQTIIIQWITILKVELVEHKEMINNMRNLLLNKKSLTVNLKNDEIG
jgi:hypothetical protein